MCLVFLRHKFYIILSVVNQAPWDTDKIVFHSARRDIFLAFQKIITTFGNHMSNADFFGTAFALCLLRESSKRPLRPEFTNFLFICHLFISIKTSNTSTSDCCPNYCCFLFYRSTKLAPKLVRLSWDSSELLLRCAIWVHRTPYFVVASFDPLE